MIIKKLKKNYWCKCGKEYHPHKRIKRKDLHGKGEFASIGVRDKDSIDFCCESMKHHFWDTIIFGNQDWGVDIGVYIIKTEERGYDDFEQELIKINYCPFCGNKIEVKGLK